MKFQIDDWVLYCRFPAVKALKEDKLPAVVLDILPEDEFHDYKIFIDGTGKIVNVKEDKLEAVPEMLRQGI
jgi:hypothetical protein